MIHMAIVNGENGDFPSSTPQLDFGDFPHVSHVSPAAGVLRWHSHVDLAIDRGGGRAPSKESTRVILKMPNENPMPFLKIPWTAGNSWNTTKSFSGKLEIYAFYVLDGDIQ